MATKTLSKRINVTLPEGLLRELRSYIPRPQRNQFVVDLVEREIRRLRLVRALQESAGAWLPEDHPDLATADEIDQHVRRLRAINRPRSWAELAAEPERNG